MTTLVPVAAPEKTGSRNWQSLTSSSSLGVRSIAGSNSVGSIRNGGNIADLPYFNSTASPWAQKIGHAIFCPAACPAEGGLTWRENSASFGLLIGGAFEAGPKVPSNVPWTFDTMDKKFDATYTEILTMPDREPDLVTATISRKGEFLISGYWKDDPAGLIRQTRASNHYGMLSTSAARLATLDNGLVNNFTRYPNLRVGHVFYTDVTKLIK